MRTGEGKTFVPTLAAVLNGLTGRGAHVVTVNDYLARRDAQWMGPAYHFLGLSVGVITHDTSYLFEPGLPDHGRAADQPAPVTRREAYAADITYGTNNEFGFDYLRDNMVDQLDGRVQRERSFAIVDEVDNILIDEARTPLIISGQAEESADLYFTFARLVPKLQGAARGRRGGRRLLPRPQGQGGQSRPRRASTRSRSSSASRTCTTPTRGSRATSTRRSRRTPCTSATATTSSRTARSSSSTSSRAARCPAGAGARACTRRSRPRRACASSARAGPSPRSRSRTTSGCTTSWPA